MLPDTLPPGFRSAGLPVLSAASASAAPPAAPSSWLIRIPEIFTPFAPEILSGLGAVSGAKSPGAGWHLIRLADPDRIHTGPSAPFVRWNLPLHHSWPCHPPAMDSFIEKAAQALHRKFAPLQPQSLRTGALLTSVPDRYYKNLASNLRGRALQLFPPFPEAAESGRPVSPDLPVLFCLVGREGLFAGLQSPRMANGAYPGGTRFIAQSGPDTISRAGAKVAEALHHLQLHRPPLPSGSHWLELGASPGGMTSELLRLGHRVTALDRAPLDPRLHGHPGLIFRKTDAASFQPPPGTLYDALLCDMNGGAAHALRLLVPLTRFLRPAAPVIFTLKTPGAATFGALQQAITQAKARLQAAGLHLLHLTHLTYNRQEFTCLLETPPG